MPGTASPPEMCAVLLLRNNGGIEEYRTRLLLLMSVARVMYKSHHIVHKMPHIMQCLL